MWVLYEKAASKATSAEPPPLPMGNRNRTIELSTVPVQAPSGGGGIIPFGSASTTLYLLCPTGHGRYIIIYGKEQLGPDPSIDATTMMSGACSQRGFRLVLLGQLHQMSLLISPQNIILTISSSEKF